MQLWPFKAGSCDCLFHVKPTSVLKGKAKTGQTCVLSWEEA